MTDTAASDSAPLEPRKVRSTWSAAAITSSIVTAFIASACCIGPLVLALLGIGGGALLVQFEPYRFHFTVVTLGFLGAGFYLQYRKPKVGSAEGDACGCERPRVNRVGRVLLWTATVLVVGFLATPYLLPVALG